MPTNKPLPNRPRLDQLRHQAKALQRGVRSGESEALARIDARYPGCLSGGVDTFSLTTAQLVVAREYGFASWPKLKHYVDAVTTYRWDVLPTERELAGEFCWLACLTYTGQDAPERWARARAVLAEQPTLAEHDIYAAAAAGAASTVERLLEAEPTLARQRGGPHRWSPLFYLAYSRLDPDAPAEPVLRSARLLLEAGADPNEGYLWNGQPYVFTLLTGAFGEGEQGPVRQPRHPHSLALARLLLEAGANPNDDQSLYNRMFQPANDHLELLFEFGLGSGDGGPWHERLGDLHDTPGGKLRFQLRWAIEHGFLDRVRLLAAHDVSLNARFDDGYLPSELAELNGEEAIAQFLSEQGATPPEVDPVDQLLAAALRADAAAVEALRAAHPGVLESAISRRPGLMSWAASAPGREPVVELLMSLGFDINAYGRGDAPRPGGRETALHNAASRGDVSLTRKLLALGADPNIRDLEFNATPLGWARHENQPETTTLLTPLTTDDT
ncbi:ankyrin repeat domain-containing protein [Flindersiella endophytica]